VIYDFYKLYKQRILRQRRGKTLALKQNFTLPYGEKGLQEKELFRAKLM